MTMREMQFRSLGAHGFHRVAYAEWGDHGRQRVVVCVHGLTRNGRDFDALAAALEGAYGIACPDVAGRGRSDWLAEADAYGYPQYCADLTALIARLGADAVDWVGTSMGGLIGMVMASMPNSPIRRLVLNDVGPFLPKAAVARIGEYAGEAPDFADLDEAASYFARVNAPFGPLSPAQWRHLAEHSVRARADGRLELKRDPAIGAAFAEREPADVDMWDVWERVTCPVLVLRGADSDVLLAETAEEMRGRGPGAELREFAGIGHAPALMADDQIAAIRDWLAADG
ncbi:MAG: alpha/beta fold hydrolase [Alphaproteobacteria bacterium]